MTRSRSGSGRIAVALAATPVLLPAAWLADPAAPAPAPVAQRSADSGSAVHHDSGAGRKQTLSATTAGRSYTLTLISKDGTCTGDPTYTLYSDTTTA